MLFDVRENRFISWENLRYIITFSKTKIEKMKRPGLSFWLSYFLNNDPDQSRLYHYYYYINYSLGILRYLIINV